MLALFSLLFDSVNQFPLCRENLQRVFIGLFKQNKNRAVLSECVMETFFFTPVELLYFFVRSVCFVLRKSLMKYVYASVKAMEAQPAERDIAGKSRSGMRAEIAVFQSLRACFGNVLQVLKQLSPFLGIFRQGRKVMLLHGVFVHIK